MTYKIHPATMDDLEWVRDVAGYRMLSEEVKRPELWHKESLTNLISVGIQNETVLIVKRGDERAGVLGSLILPHYLNTTIKTLTEIVWYVMPEHRGGKAGYLLLKAFSDLSTELNIPATLSVLPHTPVHESAMSRFGFKVNEHSYLKD